MVEEDKKARVKKVIPRVLKAAVLSIIFYFIVYYISSLLSPFESFFPLYRPLTNFFAAIFIILLFAAELSYGTVLRYAFSFAKTLVFILYLIYVLNGGILNLSIPMYEGPMNIIVDVRIFLTMLILVLILGLSKNVLQTMKFLSEEVTKDQVAATWPSIKKLKG